MIELFNGQRSFQEIAELYSSQAGAEYSVEDLKEFAGSVESLGFWYKTPQETNVQLMRMSADERRKFLKSKKNRYGDLSEIAFPAMDPDKFVTWLYGKTSWIYTGWFTLLTLAAFSVSAVISITHWQEIGQDTLEFFNFTDKSWMDLAAFYILAVVILCIHELAHGHAAKHYGARVPAMGFLLIYLTPAFYTDTTEGYVRATTYQRIVIAMAGVWSELMICALATPIWWATPPNTSVHDMAYYVMLMTGIAAVLLNWNPLMKLDGYQMLTEIVGVAELKEDSTAYALAWVKRHIWRLPVEVPFVPRRRRSGFAVYALLSGAYSYTVLYILASFAGNVFRNFNPDWSFVPELAVAGLIFRSRIRKLVEFMKFVYLDKKDRIREWFTLPRSLLIAASVTIFMSLPLWHENALGRFFLEPAHEAVIRTLVPGTVTDVFAREGLLVDRGAPLVRLRNLSLQSNIEQSRADNEVASSLANAAFLHYTNLGLALRNRDRSAQQREQWQARGTYLELNSPLAGIVLTPRPEDRLGAFVPEGSDLVVVADMAQMRARVYISEHDMYKVQPGAAAKLVVDGIARKWRCNILTVSPVSGASDPRILEQSQYSGLNTPVFYVADVIIPNPEGTLKPGMGGVARIYGERRSLMGLAWKGICQFFSRKIW
ncbi:MAG: efflux RND transporter periplasmic adaptor subunit [Candidatus Acidiferrum sp.]